MQRLNDRLRALDAQRPTTWQWVWRNAGETTADAIERAGLEPTANTIIFQWKQQEVRHADHSTPNLQS